MIFDDHEVTDDWNLSPLWRDRVMTTSLGVTIVRNALLAYALFQDWGNDPGQVRDERAAPRSPRAGRADVPRDGRDRARPGGGGTPRYAVRLRPARHHPARRPGRRRQATGHLALQRRRTQASRHRARQPDAAQLWLAQRPAGQRGHRRAARANPAGPAAGRPRAAGRHRAAAGHRPPAARRAGGAADLPDLRHREGLPARLLAGSEQQDGPARHARHQPRRGGGLVLRCRHVRGAAQAAGRVRPGGTAVGRRPLHGQHTDELLAQGSAPARAPRPVHLQWIQERDARLHQRHRSQPRLRAAARAGQARRRARGLGPSARRSRDHARRHDPGRLAARAPGTRCEIHRC